MQLFCTTLVLKVKLKLDFSGLLSGSNSNSNIFADFSSDLLILRFDADFKFQFTTTLGVLTLMSSAGCLIVSICLTSIHCPPV